MRNGGRFNLGVYAFKTLRKHRFLWKDHARGAERPQDARPGGRGGFGGPAAVRPSLWGQPGAGMTFQKAT